MDQAIYKLVAELLFSDKDSWSRAIGVLGGFHTELSYLNALGKRYAGSGIEESAVAGGLVASGSVQSTLLGKHYNRGMYLHKLIAEALLHILFKLCIANNPMTNDNLMHITKITTEEQYDDFVTSEAFNSFVSDVIECN